MLNVLHGYEILYYLMVKKLTYALYQDVFNGMPKVESLVLLFAKPKVCFISTQYYQVNKNCFLLLDDRFVLKEMPKSEIQLFLDSAHNYFLYMQKCLTSGQPTLLGKIVGIYQIIFRNSNTNATLRTNLLVMENLFYNRIVTHKFDLKGSMRNRLVNPDNQDGEIVLLDENLLKSECTVSKVFGRY